MKKSSKTIGILATGAVHCSLEGKHGTYIDMFRDFLHLADNKTEIKGYEILNEVFPKSVTECDGWLITGSPHGVYDDLPWIEPLKAFVREAINVNVPIVGICFGHQLLAEALGGRTIKSDKGWGVGVHSYEVNKKYDWMKAQKDNFLIHVMHQDQIVEIPEGTKVIAKSDFCPYAALSYDDKAISFQGHPEFSRDYEHDLILLRKGCVIPEEESEKAIRSLENSVDNTIVSRWVNDFLERKINTPNKNL